MDTSTVKRLLPFLILLALFAYNIDAQPINSFPNGATTIDGTNSNIKYQNFKTGEALPAYQEGRIFYDSGTAALSYYPAIQGSIMQIGQELWIYGYNAGVATITNGMAVRATGSLFGVLPILTPSKADASSTARVDAICTGDVSPSSAGLFTITGMLNDVDTSAFTVGDELFLSAATAGELTNVEPVAPNMVVKCAVVLKKHATDGKMQACIHIRGALGRAQFADGLDTIGSISEGGTSLTAKYLLLSTATANITATKELTGFESPESVSMSYDSTERKVTLTQTDGVIVWWRGTRHNLGSPWVSAAHDDAQGAWYLSASGTGALDIKWTDELWNFYDVQVAQVKKGANDTIAIKDTHGLMQWQTHLAEHFSVGTYRYSGGFLTDGTYTVASTTIDNTPGFDSAVIYDEDSPTTIPVWTEGTYTRLSFTGTGTVAFETTGTSIASIGTTYPFFYNYSGGTFTRTETVTGRFLNYYQLIIPVGSDVNSQLYRMVILQPQSAYTSLAAAQAEDFRQLQLGSLTFFAPELVAFARITVQTSASYGSAGKFRIESVSYLTGSKASQVTIANLTVPNNADTVQASVTDFNSILTAADNTVQKALDTLDNNAIGTTTFTDHNATSTAHNSTTLASAAYVTGYAAKLAGDVAQDFSVNALTASMPFVIASTTVAQVATNTTVTVINFSNETCDFGGNYDGTNKFVAPYNGIYHVEANLFWENNANGARQIRILRGGTMIRYSAITPGSGNPTSNVSGDIILNTNEEIQIAVYQDSGADISIISADTNVFSVRCVQKLP